MVKRTIRNVSASEVEQVQLEAQNITSRSSFVTVPDIFVQKEVDRPTRLLQFVAFVHLPFSFRSLDLFCSFTLV